MTTEERIALHQVKGMLQAHLFINAVTCQVTEELKAERKSDYLRGQDSGRKAAATKAMEQGQVVLQAVNTILKGDYNV